MIRHLTRPKGTAAIRIWQPPDWPVGEPPAAGLVVEWQRQAGHPTSYALLGGAAADGFELLVDADGSPFDDALAGRADQVRFGLPDEYRASTMEAIRIAAPAGFRITVAAHGTVGSSIVAFRTTALLLGRLAAYDESVVDEAVWRQFSECMAEAGSWHGRQ